MVPAVRPLGPLSMARGCARIDSRPDTAKIGSVDRVEVHHARLLAVIGIRKTFPHGLGQNRKSSMRAYVFRCSPNIAKMLRHVRLVPIPEVPKQSATAAVHPAYVLRCIVDLGVLGRCLSMQ
jgi:hypothetical protein